MELLSKENTVKSIIIIFAFALGFVQCTSEAPAPVKQAAHSAVQVSWKTAVPQWSASQSEWQFSGIWEAAEQNVYDVSFPGAVKVVRYHVRPGQTVGKGALLAEISSPGLTELQSNYLARKAESATQKLSFQRWEQLHEQRSASDLEWSSAQRDWKLVQNACDALAASLENYGVKAENLERVQPTIKVYSPAAGQVQGLTVATGAFLPAEQPLTTLFAMKEPRVVAEVVPEVANQLMRGAKAHVHSSSGVLECEVRAISKTANADGMVMMWLEPKEAFADWFSGAPADISAFAAADSAWAVPTTALQYEGAQAFVIAESDGQLTRLNVDILAKNNKTAFLKEMPQPVPHVIIEHVNRAAAQLAE